MKNISLTFGFTQTGIYLSDEINLDDEFDYLGETYYNPLQDEIYNTWWDNTQGE